MNNPSNNGRRIAAWFVTGSLPPHFSGAGRNDILLAPLCSDQGLDITLVTSHHPGDPRRDRINGVPVLRIPMGDHTIASRLLGPLHLIRHLSMKPRPALIRFRGFSFRISLMLSMIRLAFPDIKIIVQPAMLGGDDAFSIKQKPLGPLLIRQIMRADVIFSMNTLIGDSFLATGYPADRIYPVNNPIDIDTFRPLAQYEKLALRRRLGLPQDAFVFVTSGVISTRKSQSLVTEAFFQLLSGNSYKNAYLIHMGPTAAELGALGRTDAAHNTLVEEHAINSLLSASGYRDRVILVGYQRNPAHYLQASDVFVHASCYEGEANAINEALACALPCLVPDLPLYADQASLSCSLRFEAGSPVALSEAMSLITADSTLCQSMATAARQHIMSTRNPHVIANYIAALVRALVDQP